MSDVGEDPEREWALASAYVDDDLDPAHRALVEADPHLRARVDEVRRIREALAEPVEVPATTRRAAIGAALAAFDDATERDGISLTGASMHSVDERRRRRMRWFGGAAAAAVVALVIGLVVRDPATDHPLGSSKAVATTGGGLVQAATGAAEAGDTTAQRTESAAADTASTTFAAA